MHLKVRGLLNGLLLIQFLLFPSRSAESTEIPHKESFTSIASVAALRRKICFHSGAIKLPPQLGQVVEWNDSDKAELLALLKQTERIAPGLLGSATSSGPLTLIRSTSNDGQRIRAAACAWPGAIVISDKFFESPNLAETLTHELVHSCDFGQRISLSKHWLENCGPLITRLRFRASLLDAPLQEKLGTALARKGVWPSIYGCINAQEALAEYVPRHSSEATTENPYFRKIYHALLYPTRQERLVQPIIKQAEFAFFTGDYKSARSLFLKCQGISSGITECRLGECEYQLHNYDAALLYSMGAIKKLTASNVPPDEPVYMHALDVQAFALSITGKTERAKAVLDKILQLDPFDAAARVCRTSCESKLGLDAAALEDRCLQTDIRRIFPISAFAAAQDLPFVNDLFDFLIENGNDAARYAAIRAKLYDEIARLRHDGLTYSEALAELHSCLFISGRYKQFILKEIAELTTYFDRHEISKHDDVKVTLNAAGLNDSSTAFFSHATELFPQSEHSRSKLICITHISPIASGRLNSLLQSKTYLESVSPTPRRISEDGLITIFLSRLPLGRLQGAEKGSTSTSTRPASR